MDPTYVDPATQGMQPAPRTTRQPVQTPQPAASGATPAVDAVENVVRLAGNLDVRSVGHIRQTLNDLIDSTAGDVVVDLAAVDVVDATGLGLLVAAHRRVERLGRNLVLRHPLPPVVRILAVTRLSRVLHVERGLAMPV